MPLTAWSHTGFLENSDSSELSGHDTLQLAISDAAKEAMIEGNGQQYEVRGGIVTIAYVANIDLPEDALDDETATNNLIVIANPASLGTMVVFQLTKEQNIHLAATLEDCASVGSTLISLAFTVGTNAPLPSLVRRLHAVSKLNTEWGQTVKPLFAAFIAQGSRTMHEVMSAPSGN